MGKHGPQKTPAGVLARRGSRRAEGDGDVPMPPAADLTPPESLIGVSRDLWMELAPALNSAGLLRETDRIMFEVLCRTYFEVRAAEQATAKKDWISLFLRLAKEFGLTPLSRGAITVAPEKKTTPKTRKYNLVG